MSDAIIDVLSSVFAQFGRIFVVVFQTMWDITTGLITATFDLSLSATGTLISSVPAPQFLMQYSLQLLTGRMGSDILYFAPVFNTPQSLAMPSIGVVSRLFIRRFFTLGQWW